MGRKSTKSRRFRRSMRARAKYAASCRHRYKITSSPDKLSDNLEDNESEPAPIMDIDLDLKFDPDEMILPDNLDEINGLDNDHNQSDKNSQIETSAPEPLNLIKSLLALIVEGRKPPEPVASIVDLLNYLESCGTIIITEDDEDRIRCKIYGFYTGYQTEIKDESEEFHSSTQNQVNENSSLRKRVASSSKKPKIPKPIISSPSRNQNQSTTTNTHNSRKVAKTRLPDSSDDSDEDSEPPMSVTKQPNPKVYYVTRQPPSQRQPPVANQPTERAKGKKFFTSNRPRKVVQIIVSKKSPLIGKRKQAVPIPEKVSISAANSQDMKNVDSNRPTGNFFEIIAEIPNASVIQMTQNQNQDFSAEVAADVNSLPSTSTSGIENPRLPTPDSTTTFPKPLPPSFYRKKLLNIQGVKIMKKSKILQYKCGQCGKVLMGGSQSLKEHMALHLNLRNHLCQTCGKTFKTERCLANHNLIHQGEKKYLCDKCPMAFLRAHALVRHQRTHTGEKNYVCHVCGDKFVSNHGLRSHSVIHSEERPLKCTMCPKTFRRPDHLLAHTRIHTGVKPYKCEPCGKSWVQIGSLILHNRTHHGIVKSKDN